MNQGSQSNELMQELSDKIKTARSLLIVLETDIAAESSDSVHFDVVRVVHNILNEAQKILTGLQ